MNTRALGKVVVARCETEAQPWLETLSKAGIEAEALPLIQRKTLAISTEERHILQQLPGFRWVFFTSGHAVDSVARHREGRAWPQHCSIGAIGPATAACIRTQDWPVELVAPGGTGAALAEAFLERGHEARSHPILLPIAREARPELSFALQHAGHPLRRIELYETIDRPGPTPQADTLVLLFSPSAVRSLARRWHHATPARVWAIGPTTAAAAVEAGMDVQSTLPGRTPRDLELVLAG